jgi:hypothetical protein
MRATSIGYMTENAARVALRGIGGKSRKRVMGVELGFVLRWLWRRNRPFKLLFLNQQPANSKQDVRRKNVPLEHRNVERVLKPEMNSIWETFARRLTIADRPDRPIPQAGRLSVTPGQYPL